MIIERKHSAQIGVEKDSGKIMVLLLRGAWDRIAALRRWQAVVNRWNEMIMIDEVVTIGCVAWAWVDQTRVSGSNIGRCMF